MSDAQTDRQTEGAADTPRPDDPVSVVIPGFGPNGEARRVIMTYDEGVMLQHELRMALRRPVSSATPPAS